MRFTQNIVGLKVLGRSNQPVGKLTDLIISLKGSYPIVSAVVIKFDAISYIGETPLVEKAKNIKLIVPYEQISFSSKQVKLKLPESSLHSRYLAKDEILIGRDIVDAVITTSDSQSIGRVNDVVVFEKGDKLEVFGLGVGIIGIVAKLGLEIPIEILDKGFGKSFVETVINWRYVKNYHPHKGEIMLSVSKKIEASNQIDYGQSKGIKEPEKFKKPPFIIIPWLFIEKTFKKRRIK